MAVSGGSPRLLNNLSTGIGIVAGLVAIFYLVGLLVLGLRLQQYGLPVESISGQLPQQSLAVVGLSEVGLPLAFIAVIYAASHLLAHEVRNQLKGDDPRAARTWGPATWATIWALGSGLGTASVRSAAETITWSSSRGALFAGAIVLAVLLGCAGARLMQRRIRRAFDGSQFPLTLVVMAALVSISTIPIWIVNGITLPLPDATLCPKSATGTPTIGWLIGATSDRLYVGVASAPVRGQNRRYIVSVPAGDFNLLEGGYLNVAGSRPKIAGLCTGLQ